MEDNPDSRTTLQDLLTLEGHEVEVAEDGLQGVERALAWSPDVALVDIDLPVLDGYEVARRLRREPRGRAVRLVALTGYGLAGHREKAREAGFDAFVVKPVDLGELRRLIASAPRGIPGEGRGDGAEGTPGVPPTRG
ncbi:response regulator [Myxococcota bacterium]|nr:response regulator [Myxococcota bacterium]